MKGRTKAERYGDRSRDSFMHWFTPPTATMGRLDLGQRKESRAASGYPIWVQ